MTQISRYLRFSRQDWAQLRASTPLPLNDEDLCRLRGINESISLQEVADTYLPISRLLNLHVNSSQSLHKATEMFLDSHSGKVPYIIGIAGSVAVGKSTTARILQALLSRWPNHPKVDLVTTDGFLYPTHVLEDRGLAKRKGFPESYDQHRLVHFLNDVKSGRKEVSAPVYSHLIYDIVEGKLQKVHQPDILILEGLNVLQSREARVPNRSSRVFVSDFFDFSIYMDANESLIETWYVERFIKLCETVFKNPDSYFHRYAHLSEVDRITTAHAIWREINGPNLKDNIRPTRERANLILRKGEDHAIEEIQLRRL